MFEAVIIVVSAALVTAAYVFGVVRFRRRRERPWPVQRTLFFVLGVAGAALAVAPPLDDVADASFAAHMVQHLILTNLAAPALLLGAPLLLLLATAPATAARRIVTVLRGRVAHALVSPFVCWPVFIVTLWAIHFSPFFAYALDHEPAHILEHLLFIGTALWFWLPVIVITTGPAFRTPLAFPVRMLYLLIAMPAEAFLGFAIYGARHVLFAHYAAGGIDDQQRAGEIMWIGSGVTMFVAFMAVGAVWGQREQARSV